MGVDEIFVLMCSPCVNSEDVNFFNVAKSIDCGSRI